MSGRRRRRMLRLRFEMNPVTASGKTHMDLRARQLAGPCCMGEDMKNLWREEFEIRSSLCDTEGRLGIRNTFDLFMDMASVHAAHLGVSYFDMLEQRCYWVAVRTRLRFYHRPHLRETAAAETWPGKPGLAKSDRYYRLLCGGEVAAEGRTEWAAQDIDTGAVRRTDSFGFPMDLDFCAERVCAEPFTRFRDFDTDGEEPVRMYTVDSMDIDMGKHMNNVAYIRMMLGTFSTRELEEMQISEVEISYRRACFEGEELKVFRRFENGVWLLQVVRPDGETAVHARIRGGSM